MSKSTLAKCEKKILALNFHLAEKENENEFFAKVIWRRQKSGFSENE
jgi:hypothetical protein